MFKCFYFRLLQFFAQLGISKFTGEIEKKNIIQTFWDAYSVPVRKNGDYCGVVDNGCIHYRLYESISECLPRYCCDPSAGRVFREKACKNLIKTENNLFMIRDKP